MNSMKLFRRVAGQACCSVRTAAAIALLMGVAGSTAAQDAASPRVALPSLRQALPAGGGVAGDLPASQPVPAVTVQLKRSAAQQADLDEYLKLVGTKGSAEYHHWLTPEQFAQRFAPTAAHVVPVTAWLSAQGLQVESVSLGGMRLVASGTAAQVSTAFGVRLQRYALAAGDRVAVDGTLTVPDSLAGSVLAVGGLDQTAAGVDAVAGLEAAVDANRSAVLAVDLAGASASVEELTAVLEQASAQGQTVVLQHVTAAVLPAHALVLVSSAAAAMDVSGADVAVTPRPDWQVAAGLPADGLRAMPDAAVADAGALTAALQQVVTTGGARQGEVAATFYKLAAVKDLFTHADTTVPVGTWSATDGLGTVDPVALVKAWPYGVTAPNSTTISLSDHTVVHGSNITLTATVTGSSGTPTGTVSFGSSQGGTLGSTALNSAGVAVSTFNSLPGGLYGFSGTYNGDNTYASSTTNVDTATVNPEPAVVSGSIVRPVPYGADIAVVVSVKSGSGVGTPAGTVMVYPYGTNVGTTTYTGTLAPSSTAGTSVATVNVPASNVGSFTFQTNCTTDASFSCFQPASFAVTVTKATPLMSLAQTGTAAAATLTATVSKQTSSSASVTAPTGNVQFLDGATVLGSATLNNAGVATYTGALASGTTHAVTASYAGDGNYSSASATANATVKVTPSVTLAVVTAGTTLSATVAPPSGTTTVPTGSVQFLLGATALGSGVVNSAGVATLSGAYGSGILTAVYGGDANFDAATSNAIDTTKALPTVALVKTSTDSAANTVALTATVMNGTAVATTATGTMTFLDGTTSLGTGTVTAGVASFSGSLSPTASANRLMAQAVVVTTHSLTAAYGGDTSFNPATSNAVTANATTTSITTSTSLTSSSGYTGPYGTAFSLTSVVTPASYVTAGTAPSGTITILDAGIAVGTGTLAAGTATIAVSTLTVGTHSLVAMYGGDSNYAPSSSAAVVFTITPLTATITATIAPTGSIPYGYDANVAVNATAASGTVAPSGTVMATVSGNNGTYMATLLGTTGSLVSTASIPVPVPTPGSYTVAVKCNVNLVCNTVTLAFTTTKGFTTTTINGVTPTTPQAATPVSISATVANSGTGTGTYRYSGTVSFYSNNKFLGSGSVVNGLATARVVFLSAATQSVTAIYSGDVNWTGSTSDPVSVTPTPVPANIVLSSNALSGIVGQNITLTVAVGSGVTNAALVPSGTVTFYDTFNGVVVNLGSAAVLSNGLNTGYAQLSTTGLRAGSHTIMAVYSGDGVFLKTTSSNLVVNIGDFALSFAPSTLSVSSGGTAKGVLTVTGLNGFSGAIALGCSTSAGTETNCTVSPTLVNTGGTAQFTISTTKNSAALVRIAGAGALLALGFVRRRRRLVALLSLLLVVVMAGGGCSQAVVTDNAASGGGTPLGTFSLTITAASTDAPVNARHTYVIPVTVQ